MIDGVVGSALELLRTLEAIDSASHKLNVHSELMIAGRSCHFSSHGFHLIDKRQRVAERRA